MTTGTPPNNLQQWTNESSAFRSPNPEVKSREIIFPDVENRTHHLSGYSVSQASELLIDRNSLCRQIEAGLLRFRSAKRDD